MPGPAGGHQHDSAGERHEHDVHGRAQHHQAHIINHPR